MSSRKNKIESSQNRSMDHRPGPSEEATRDLGGSRGTVLGTDGLSNSSRFSQNESKPRESSQRGAPSRRLNINKGTNQLGQGSTSPKNPCVDDLTTSFSNIVRLKKPGENSKEKGRAVGQKGMKAPRVHLQKSKEVHLDDEGAYETITPVSFVGSSYQTKVTMALLQELRREKYDSPCIGIEVKAAMSMDDIVLRYTVNERKVCLFLQVKHTWVSGKISFKDLTNESSHYGAFYLKKYFDSYLGIMKGPLLKSLDFQEKQLVIFTSGSFDQNLEKIFEPFIDKDSILNSIAKKGSGLFKLTKDECDQKKKLISQLNLSHDIQEVTDFFDCLVFAVGNYHDGKALDDHIKKRLGESFNLSNANIIFASLFYEEMSWAKERKKIFP